MRFQDLKNYLNKILVFYYPNRAGYWNSITRCCISEKPVKLGRYYLDFSSKVDYPDKFSLEGIPLYSFFGQPYIEHPIVIAQYAFGLFEYLYKTNFCDSVLRNKFLKMADWFVNNKTYLCGGVGWQVQYKIPEYGMNEPWVSSLAQGEAISILTRATLLTQNVEYDKLSIEALAPFEHEIKNGGLINYFNSIPIYEEYPSPIRTVGVLNGFMFSLFGLYDLILLNKNPKAQYLFSKGIESLKKLLPYYDLKFWTRYYLFDYPKKYAASYTYQNLMAEQLMALHYITEEKLFLEYSEKWLGYTKSFIKKNRALLQKLFYAKTISSNN